MVFLQRIVLVDRTVVKLLFPAGIFIDGLTLPDDPVLIGQQAFNANRSARVDLARTDTDFRAEAILESITEAG